MRGGVVKSDKCKVQSAKCEPRTHSARPILHFALCTLHFALCPCGGLLAPAAAVSAAASRQDAAAGGLSEAIPVDGPPFRARLSAIDAQWQLTLQAQEGRRVIPAAGLVSWGNWAETGQKPLVVLADGGLLVADATIAKGNLVCRSGLFGQITLPLDRAAGAVFAPPGDGLGRDLLIDRIASATGQSDRLLLANGDQLSGSVLAIQDGKIRMRTPAGRVEVVEVRRTTAVIFNPLLKSRVESPESRVESAESASPLSTFHQLSAWVGFRDGSRLLARGLVLDDKSAAVTIAGGFTWKSPADGLVALQPLGGQVNYLSDLPAKYRYTPYLSWREEGGGIRDWGLEEDDKTPTARAQNPAPNPQSPIHNPQSPAPRSALAWPYRADRSVSGGLLRAGGRLYLKGLGVHSAAQLTYALDKPYRRFQAALAIDDETGGRGSVVFRVAVDDQVRYTSPIVRGGQTPLPISVDVTGAKRLDLFVDFADRADELDHADWLDARLVR
jgi:hypothetical protein